jgi:Putative beta-barrel porin-2, OmpL-like. bbp2
MNKTIKALALLASVVLMGVSAPVMAQTAAATPVVPVVKVDGLVDAYYTYNFTNSANKLQGSGNIGQFWNSTDGSYSIGLAETKITATEGAATGVVELAYQDVNNLGLSSNLGVLQAYASYNTGAWTLTGGRFVTWMGNEVVEPTSNWNYSHSLLFWYTIPVWNQGIEVSLAVDPTFTINGYATDGWNNTTTPAADFDAQTYGAELAWTPNSTWKVVVNAIDGPGAVTPVSSGRLEDKWVGEAIIDFNAASDLSFALDAEYGAQDAGGTFTGVGGHTYNSADFWGADLYAKYAISSSWSAALRLEELKDIQGVLGIYTTLPAGSTDEGREATLTLTDAITPIWSISAEGRYDYAVVSGAVPGPGAGPFAAGSADQVTATLSTALVF